MTLIQKIAAVFERELTKVFEREQKEDGKNGRPNYMKQSILGCRWRAFWGIFVAVIKSFPEMVNILGLSIAVHREEKHNENKTRTIRSLSRKTGLNRSSVKNAGGFWN